MFCSQVETWLQRHVTKGKVLWHGAKVEVGPKCVHMCMFTQGRWKNLALSRPSWLEGFAELVTFLGGNGAGAAKQLRAALSKDGTYDPAYAQHLEEWHKARLKKYGFYGTGECCPVFSSPLPGNFRDASDFIGISVFFFFTRVSTCSSLVC